MSTEQSGKSFSPMFVVCLADMFIMLASHWLNMTKRIQTHRLQTMLREAVTAGIKAFAKGFPSPMEDLKCLKYK